MTVDAAWSTLEASLHGRSVLHRMRDGEGPPLLLVHGIGPGTTGAANFAPLIWAVASTCPIHLIDLAGFGGSRGTLEQPGFDPPLWLAQIEQALDRIGRPTLLVGNSVGGALALKVASRRPELLGVIGVGAAAAAAPATPELRAFWRAPTTPEHLAEAMRPMTSAQASPARSVVMSRWKAFEDPAYAVWFDEALADAETCLAAVAVSPQDAARIAVPVHLLHGRDDRACPIEPLIAFVLRDLPQADLTVLGACGHNVIFERTADVLWAINQLRTRACFQ